jgi:hypothetical protein
MYRYFTGCSFKSIKIIDETGFPPTGMKKTGKAGG